MRVTNQREVEQAVGRRLRGIGEEIVARAKALVPVDTGSLQASIRILAETEEGIVVGSDLDYAADVHARVRFLDEAVEGRK